MFLLAAAGAAEPGAFRAGAARGNITPALGSEIVGGFLPFPSTHVHDDLWVRCLALDDGTTRVVFAVCDLLGVSAGVAHEARRLVQEETSVPAGHVLVSATHTHSAASALGNRYDVLLPEKLNDYQKAVARRIADTARCALNNLEPAHIGWASAEAPEHVFNRRWHLKPGTMPVNPFGNTDDVVKMNPARGSPDLVKPAGPTDPEVFLIAVRTPAGRPIALFANYSLHYVGGVRDADISADYYGIFNDRVQELLGADRQEPPFVSILSNGTSGDINNIDFTRKGEKIQPYEKMRAVADDVAGKVCAAYRTIAWRERATLGAAFEEIELRFRLPTPEQLARAKEILARIEPGKKPSTLPEIYADRTVKTEGMPEQWKFPLQAFCIGEIGVATFPTEVFCEIGLEMKRRSPLKPAFVVSMAHGYYGYLPTPEQYKLGGYETWLGTNRLEADAAPKMVERLLEMLTRLRQGE
jgi:hypothetical protein